MNYIEAPYPYDLDHRLETSIFLGGGITNCKNWQSDILNQLNRLTCKYTVFNPRREDWSMTQDGDESVKQIAWEFKYIHSVDIVIFYFSEETLCPITLFELGSAMGRNEHKTSPQQILVYCEENYGQKFDVQVQIDQFNDRYFQNHVDKRESFLKNYTDYNSFVNALLDVIETTRGRKEKNNGNV